MSMSVMVSSRETLRLSLTSSIELLNVRKRTAELCIYRLAEKFLSCCQTLKAYFCGLIFVVCSEDLIRVAYCPRLLFKCPDFRGLIFCFRALRDENN